MIRGGKIIEHAPLRALDAAEGEPVRIAVALAEPDSRLPEVLKAIPGIVVERVDERSAVLSANGGPTARRILLKSLVDAGLPVVEFSAERPGLQDAYLARMRAAGSGSPSGASGGDSGGASGGSPSE
jgi:hypothetical protein